MMDRGFSNADALSVGGSSVAVMICDMKKRPRSQFLALVVILVWVVAPHDMVCKGSALGQQAATDRSRLVSPRSNLYKCRRDFCACGKARQTTWACISS
ncbi:hypothetical protein Plhal304r1_c063g0150941 [Plasmopara halstedii]